jgi:4-phospho-D-threonate 3-dehydrogenase / 4-phospho-D-erythronate 3-dehydrogenase
LIPKIAITVGEITGVGPELALHCINLPEVRSRCRPILYGPSQAIQRIGRQLGLRSDVEIRCIGDLPDNSISPGHFNRATGQASFDAVDAAIRDAMLSPQSADHVDAIVTGPIQKEAWNQAGIPFPGHTELLADRTATDDYAMMLAGPELAVVLVTIHVPLADVPGLLRVDDIVHKIRLVGNVAKARHSRSPSASNRLPCIGVCGLNPHAGENGLFGHGEEETIIAPAIDQARREGFQVVGPLSPDTAFTPAMRNNVDVYVCMYHDQGLIPLKALSFDDGINVTLGLPIIRTSVDHGTAMDIAWQGKANPQSMQAAIEAAIDFCQHRAAHDNR